MPWLTLYENIKLVCKEKSQNLTKKIENILNNFELSEFKNSFPNTISGGMRRKVSLARAFVNKPKILLLDEPFISLDETVGNLLRQMLLKLWDQQKTTVIFVTHDLREAIYMSDRIVFLSKGPSKVIHDFKINISRPRELGDKKLDTLRTELISNHPDILSGKI